MAFVQRWPQLEKMENILLILFLCISIPIKTIGQEYLFEFPEELILKNEIKNVIIKESHPNYLAFDGEPIFHSEYSFANNGKVKSKTYLASCGTEKKIASCLIQNIFEYQLEVNTMSEIQRYPRKRIRYNPNKVYKSNKKLVKKMKEIEWQESKIVKYHKYDKKGNLLKVTLQAKPKSELIELSKYKYEYVGNKLKKKFLVDAETGNLEILDSIVYFSDRKISFHFIKNQIQSKTVYIQNGDNSRQELVYSRIGDEYKLWRTYK